ncbi:hypothetical protein A7P95_08955 [Eikenella longinqua]|uniref:DUF945 domain-containing protein n=1 Tax=Eikenella longinqua TaxID=1795827 RepID=A0A1A9RW99_9NEIS|nr:DUF945 family protein [Eikenella longinqua]OAM26868.1 hypothetical protein A7P95_08955 [Eikenella longinqua]
MNKKILIGGIAGVLLIGGAAAGGSLYADKRLTDTVYSPELMQRSFGLANFQAQTNMGAFNGTAQWQGDFLPDPCRPEQKITIRGTDTLRRSFAGYQIDTKVYIVSDSEELNRILPQGFLLNARHHISWSGNVQTSIQVPGRSVQKDGTTITWQDISGSATLHKENDELVPDEVQFNIPSIQVQADRATFALQNISHRSRHAFIGHGSLQSGNAETTLASLSFSSTPGHSIVLNNLTSTSSQNINGQNIGWGSRFNIERINITQPNGTHTIQDLRLNTVLNGLATPAVQAFSDLMARQRSSCIPQEELKAKLSEIATAVLNSGLSIQAQGNQIKLDGAPLTADAQLTLPPGQYANLDQVNPSTLLSKLQYRADIRISKGFISAAGRTFADWSNSSHSEADTQQIIDKLLAQPGASQEGDTIRLSYQQP